MMLYVNSVSLYISLYESSRMGHCSYCRGRLAGGPSLGGQAGRYSSGPARKLAEHAKKCHGELPV